MRWFNVALFMLLTCSQAFSQTEDSQSSLLDAYLSNMMAIESGDVLFVSSTTFESAPNANGKPQPFTRQQREVFHRLTFDHPNQKYRYIASGKGSVLRNTNGEEKTSEDLTSFVILSEKQKLIRVLPNRVAQINDKTVAEVFRICDAPELRTIGLFAFGSNKYGIEKAHKVIDRMSSTNESNVSPINGRLLRVEFKRLDKAIFMIARYQLDVERFLPLRYAVTAEAKNNPNQRGPVFKEQYQ